MTLLTELALKSVGVAINISLRRSENGLCMLHSAHEFRQRVLRIAIKHSGYRLEE